MYNKRKDLADLHNNFMKNRKGLSQVVTTVIFVSLALIAIGIVWAVINNLVQQGAADVEAQSQCLNVDVRANAVVENSSALSNYTVTLNRAGGGGDIEGTKIVLFAETESSDVLDIDGNIAPLGTTNTYVESITTTDTDGLTGADKIEVTPYVTDDQGNEVTCATTTFNF